MPLRYLLRAIQVGNGACHLHNAIKYAAGDVHPAHSQLHELGAFTIERHEITTLPRRHFRIHVRWTEAFGLHHASASYALANRLAAFSRACAEQVFGLKPG